MKVVFILLLFLFGCVHKSVKQDLSTRNLMFPYGSYQHFVKVEIPQQGREPKTFEFRGVVQIGADEIKVVGLSPLNSTLFRLTEDRKTQVLKVDLFVEQLKKQEGQIRNFYSVIKDMMLTPIDQNKEKPISTPYGPATVKFESFDKNQIPTMVHVVGEKFKIDVEVLGYEI